MDVKITEALDSLKTDIKSKTADEIKSAIDAIEAKHKTELETATQAVKDEFKSIQDLLEGKIKAAQDHADKLDIKLKQKDVKERSKKPFGEQLAYEIEEKTDDLNKFIRKESKYFSFELKAVSDMSTGNVTGGTRYGELFNPNIIDGVSRKVHMDQILTGGAIGAGNSFAFMREKYSTDPNLEADPPTRGVYGEGNPAPVAEGATKSQFDFDLEESSVNIETIAGWLRVTRKSMSNIPGFVSFIQRRIPERFRNVLDSQVLYGDPSQSATPNDLKGILTTGNFINQETPVNKPVSEKLIDYISLFEDFYQRDANGILLRPATFYSMFTQKASATGEYNLPFGVTIEGGVARVLGVPIFTTTALNSTDIIVGDWANGAQLLTQEAMRVEFFDQDGDNVRTNKVTIRVEGNYALPVYGSDYFIKGTTATS